MSEQVLPNGSDFATPASGSTLRQLQRFELQSYLPGDLLTKEDRASMAFGLEARVPLLDAEVVALAQRVPDRQKVSLLGGKLLLRKLAREKLPANGASGRKRGFAVPLRDFFAGPWHDEARDLAHECDSDLIDGPAAARMLDAGHSKATDIWTMAALAAWEQRLNSCRRAKPAVAAPRAKPSRPQGMPSGTSAHVILTLAADRFAECLLLAQLSSSLAGPDSSDPIWLAAFSVMGTTSASSTTSRPEAGKTSCPCLTTLI